MTEVKHNAHMRRATAPKERQKIALFSPFFYPEKISTGKYNGLLAEALVEAGIDVVAVCSHPIYPSWKPEKAVGDMPGVACYRGGESVRYPASPLARRAVLELWFAWHALKGMFRAARGADRLVAVFPPSLFMLGILPFRPRDAKVIGIVHDLQGVYAARKQGLVGRLLGKAISAVERRAFLSCHKLIFLSETMRELTVSTYQISKQRTSIQYPFVTLPRGASQGDLSENLSHHFNSGLRTIVYSGALGEKQAPSKLLDLMLQIVNLNPGWQARIYSEGPIFDELKKRCDHPRVAFNGLVPAADLPELLRRSDVQVLPQESGTSDGSLPSKLPNIIAAGTRLLCITDPGSELESIVRRYSAGRVSTSWEIKDCIAKFDELTQLPTPRGDESAQLLSQFTLGGLVKSIMSDK